MKVSEIMKSNVRTIGPDRSIVDAARHMRSFGIGCLVVIDDGAIRGIITDRDLAVRAITHEHDVNRTTVSQCMTSPVTTIDCEMDVLDAAHLMAERGIRRLPVADKGRLIGIVSNSDIARAVDQAPRDIVVGQARKAAPVE